MAETSQPQINVIKPGDFTMHNIDSPRKNKKISPLVIGILTVILAVIAVVTAMMLYQTRNQPQNPTPANASTTQTISDTFSGTGIPDPAKWNYALPAGGSMVQQNGQLVMTLPPVSATASANTAQNSATQYFTGDFSAQVDLTGIQTAGTAWQEFSFGSTVVSIRRTTSPTGDKVESLGNSTGSANLPAGTTTITAKIVRVGSIIQTFYNLPNAAPVLLSTITAGPGLTSDGALYLTTSTEAPDYVVATGGFDNFTAQVNIVGTPEPTIGTAQACTVSFTVLDTVPTPTVTLTPTPSPTPPPGATPTPTATPSPTPPPGATPTPTPVDEPNACGGSCGSNANCQSGMTCFQGFCRNPECTSSTSCVCGTTPAVATPTPEILQQAGSVNGTWIIAIAGVIILGLGGLILLAL
jgi:hypothetical protein